MIQDRLLITSDSLELGYDPTFALDAFSRPKLLSEGEYVKNILMTILFMKPGQYPSLPHIGLDIRNLLYNNWDTVIEQDLIDIIIKQCVILEPYFENNMIQIRKTMHNNQPSLMIFVDVSIQEEDVMNSSDDTSSPFFIGLSFNQIGELMCDIHKGALR